MDSKFRARYLREPQPSGEKDAAAGRGNAEPVSEPLAPPEPAIDEPGHRPVPPPTDEETTSVLPRRESSPANPFASFPPGPTGAPGPGGPPAPSWVTERPRTPPPAGPHP